MTVTELRQNLGTYVIVTALAVLIWLYAESENVKPYPPFPVSVQFVPAAGQRLAIFPSKPQQVWLTVRCATSQYDALESLAKEGAIKITVSEDPNNPEQVLILGNRFKDTPVGGLGVTITDAQPATVNVRVESLEDVVLPIEPESVVPIGVQVAAPPALDPAEATVVLPSSIAQQSDRLKLEAHLDTATVAQLDQNVPHELTAVITLPPVLRDRLRGFGTTVTPATTRVTITVRNQTDRVELKSLPILLLAPWSELQRFSVELENDRPVLTENIELSGPGDLIEAIRSGETKVWAELRLSADDLESGVTSKQLHINVPQGVTVESTIPRIGFEIAPLSGALQPTTP